jgi:hypothetical protein
MSPRDLLKRVRQRPFTPFRVVVSEGGTYDVRYPQQVIVTRDAAVIAIPGGPRTRFLRNLRASGTCCMWFD